MKIKSFEFKNIILSTETINNWVILDDVEFSLSTRTQIYNNQLFHWWNTSKTLWDLRLFTISWKIVWINATNRENAMKSLNSIVIIWTGNEFYEFKFNDFTGGEYKTNCKVFNSIKFNTKNKWEPIIDFSFELLSDKSEYLEYTTNIINEVYDPLDYVSWWIELWVVLWTEIYSVTGIEITNLWNFSARCRIQLIWTLINPKIINHTNWRNYWLTATTTNLILDNTWNTFIVEDVWIDKTSNRISWSVSILLTPWNNVFTLLADNDTTWTEFKVYYNNTFA